MYKGAVDKVYYPSLSYSSDGAYNTSWWSDGESNGIINTSAKYIQYGQKYTSYSGGHTHTFSGTTGSNGGRHHSRQATWRKLYNQILGAFMLLIGA